jgi:GlcNAc-P-P-Und epimerase
MMKKISVIGGSGFVGTNLCRQLELKQQDFEIIDLKMSNQFPEKCKIADIRDIETLRNKITGDLVVNLAAVHRDNIRDKSEYQRTNVDGAENIALVCEEKSINKIVFTSTVAVYGFAEPDTDETGAINPFNEYGRTKFKAEEKFRVWQNNGEKSLIIVRPTVIFGEGNRGNVYNLFKQIASGNFIMIGDGENKKSMAYIGNIVAFLEKCIESEAQYAVYNYIDTPDLNMKRLTSQVIKTLEVNNYFRFTMPYFFGLALGYLADLAASITGLKLPLSSIRVRKFCSTTTFTSKKNKLDSFEAPFSLQEGIDRTLQSEFISPNSKSEIFYTE